MEFRIIGSLLVFIGMLVSATAIQAYPPQFTYSDIFGDIDNPTYFKELEVLGIPHVGLPGVDGKYQNVIFSKMENGYWDLVELKEKEQNDSLLLIESVEVIVTNSSPIQVLLLVKGEVNFECSEVGRIVQSLDGILFNISIFTTANMENLEACENTSTSFKRIIPLNVYGLEAGEYFFNINGHTGRFEFTDENVTPLLGVNLDGEEPSSTPTVEYNEREYSYLESIAEEQTYVPVMISLSRYGLIAQLKNREFFRDLTEAKAQLLFKELGTEALKIGYRNSAIALVSLYVTTEGLRRLTKSRVASTFYRDDSSRTTVNDRDGSIDAIEQILNRDGIVQVELFLNIESIEFDILGDGNMKYHFLDETQTEIDALIKTIFSQPYAETMTLVSEISSEDPRPTVIVSVDKPAFYGLKEDLNLRAIRPIGFRDTRPTIFPENVMSTAIETGFANVGISLRGGEMFISSSHLTELAAESLEKSIEKAFEEIFSDIDETQLLDTATKFYQYGGIFLDLPLEALTKLHDRMDPRIYSVQLNQQLTGM